MVLHFPRPRGLRHNRSGSGTNLYFISLAISPPTGISIPILYIRYKHTISPNYGIFNYTWTFAL